MMRKSLIALVLVGLGTAAVADPGKWSVERTTSMVDKSATYHASLTAANEVAGVLDQQERPTLSVICDTESLYLGFHWPDFVEASAPGSSWVSVTWSLDGGKPETLVWIATTQAVGLNNGKARAMLSKLAGVKRIALRVPDRHGMQEAAFDIDGIAAVAADVGSMRCG